MELNEEALDALADEHVLEMLGRAEFIERFERSQDWKLFREACERLAEKAERELLDVPATNTLRIIELQVTAKFCKNTIKGIINAFKQDGVIAFSQAKKRGIIKKKGK